MAFQVELDIDPALRVALEELYRKRWILECLEAQRQADTMEAELREARAINGLGSLEMRIPAAAYHHLGLEHGYEAWNDRRYRRRFLSRAPEAKVRCYGTKIQLGWEPGMSEEITIQPKLSGHKRFVKVYREDEHSQL